MNRNHTIVSYLDDFDIIHTKLEELGGKIEKELAVIILLDGLSDDFKETKAAFNIANEVPSLTTIRSRLLEMSSVKTDNAEGEALKTKWQHGKNLMKCYRCGKLGHMAKKIAKLKLIWTIQTFKSKILKKYLIYEI